MANSLNEEIEEDDLLLVDEEYLKAEDPSFEEKVFRASGGGFGTSSETMGSAVYGKFVEADQKGRLEGYMIDRRVDEEELENN